MHVHSHACGCLQRMAAGTASLPDSSIYSVDLVSRTQDLDQGSNGSQLKTWWLMKEQKSLKGPQSRDVVRAEQEDGASKPDAAALRNQASMAGSDNGQAKSAPATVTAGSSFEEDVTSQARPTTRSPSPAEPVSPSIQTPADGTSQPAASSQGDIPCRTRPLIIPRLAQHQF